MAKRRRKKSDAGIESILMLVAGGITYYLFSESPIKHVYADPQNGAMYILVTWLVIGLTLMVLSLIVLRIYRRATYKPPTFEFNVPQARLTPKEFEEEVAGLIAALTGYRTEVVGGIGDGGIDVKVFDQKRMIGIVQCKRYSPGKYLEPSHIRELYACKQQNNVSTAYLVTTARFSQASQQLARQLGIKLMDGDDLERIRLRVREQAAVK